jgi:SPP1 gp7 family putative phage head morphogenesis protein
MPIDIQTKMNLKNRARKRENKGKNPDIEPRSTGSFPLMIERAYEREKLKEVNDAARLIKDMLLPQIPAMVEEVGLADTRQDTYVEDFEAIMAGIKAAFATIVTVRKVTGDAEDMANNVNNRNSQIFDMQVKQVIGVSPFRSEPWLQSTLSNSVSQNVSLITTLHEDYFKDVEFETLNGLERGLSTRDIAKRIQKKTGASRNRAKLIARDQVSKLNSSLASRRASDLGVKRFRWSTSADERVRASHRALNNKIFTYKDGATVDGENNVLPGQPINCRCVAVPIISSIDESLAEAKKKISSQRQISQDIKKENAREKLFREARKGLKSGRIKSGPR